MSEIYPAPTPGASLILSFRLQQKPVLVVGSGTLAAARTFAALEADSSVVVLAKGGISLACDELKWRFQRNQISFVDWDALEPDDEAEALESYLAEAPRFSLAIVTDTQAFQHRRTNSSARNIYDVFFRRNISVNMTDMPQFCDFSFTSTHRIEHQETGDKTSLQIGVTTNGHGCRLAARIRREIVANLSREVGAAVEHIGRMRSMAMEEKSDDPSVRDDQVGQNEPTEEKVVVVDTQDPPITHATGILKQASEPVESEVYEDSGVSTPNRPVPIRSFSESTTESRKRRMRWVAQVSEYWPISKLASMSSSEMNQVLAGESIPSVDSTTQATSRHFGTLEKTGRILLVGSGPGHPSLLTVATHAALTQEADLVLSDKLVPDAVLSLIPKHVELRIARKFPGNADGAQAEMMEAAVEAAKKGLTVVRLKQGDPTVFARLGEEILYFRSLGFEPVVIPGVSSALAAPTFAGIPLTQRGVAESFVVCTGVGRKGKEVVLPGYDRSRTTVVLMGVARLEQVVQTLLDTSAEQTRREGPAYPSHTPIAIIERASMLDQRVVSSTLRDIVKALECSGEQRPPGMMVIGWAVLSLYGVGDVSVLDNGAAQHDTDRVNGWLGEGVRWRVGEGLGAAGW